MSLKAKFKTDATAAAEGVWIDYKGYANTDGSVPGFKLARATKQNKKYAIALRNFTSAYETSDGTPDFSNLDDEKSEKEMLTVFLDSILIDWRNFQPEDDGVAVVFSRENAERILGAPEWLDFYLDLLGKSHKASNFRERKIEAQAKN